MTKEDIARMAWEAGLVKADDAPWMMEFLERFAKQVVRECLAQVDKMRDSFEADGESKEALGAEWIGYAIEKHFGVEE